MGRYRVTGQMSVEVSITVEGFNRKDALGNADLAWKGAEDADDCCAIYLVGWEDEGAKPEIRSGNGLVEWDDAEIIKPKETEVSPGHVTALTVVAHMIRDAVNKYRDSKLQSDADELDRLTALFNLPPEQLLERVMREVATQAEHPR